MIKYLLLALVGFTTLSAGPWLDAVKEDYENGKYAPFLSFFERTFDKSKEECRKLPGNSEPQELPFPFDPKGLFLLGKWGARMEYLNVKLRQILLNGKEAEAEALGFDIKKIDEYTSVLLLDLKNQEGPLSPEVESLFQDILHDTESKVVEMLNTPINF